MEENKIAVKGKANKDIVKKRASLTTPEKADALNIISTNGLNLFLDNSLSKYANDKFIIEQTEIANRKFAQNK
jgi:hypothetical protein